MPDPVEWLNSNDVTRYLRGDTLVDWLERYGERHGFIRDSDRPRYAPECEMSLFLREKVRDNASAAVGSTTCDHDTGELRIVHKTQRRLALPTGD